VSSGFCLVAQSGSGATVRNGSKLPGTATEDYGAWRIVGPAQSGEVADPISRFADPGGVWVRTRTRATC